MHFINVLMYFLNKILKTIIKTCVNWHWSTSEEVLYISQQKSLPTPDFKFNLLPNLLDARPIIYGSYKVNVSPQPLSSLLSVQSIAPLQTLLSSMHWPELHMYCCGAQVGSWVTHKLSSSSEPSKQSASPSQMLYFEMQAPFPQVNSEVLQVL